VSSLRIPPEQVPSFTKLRSLSSQTASQLQSAMASAAERKEGADLSPEDVGPVGGLDELELGKILDALGVLYHVRAYWDVPLDELVADVADNMRSADPSLTPGAATVEFMERIKRLLSIDSLAVAAKADVLTAEHERTLHGLRILTDARPIFGNDVQKPPDAIAIGHMLKLTFHRGGRLEEEFFALDEDDLHSLKEAVQRAEVKANSLRAALAKSQLKVISTD
jgi:hypothetical protein